MGKKKHRKDKDRKVGDRWDNGGARDTRRDTMAPLAGMAAALVQQANRPEARQLLATGLTMAAAAASAALMKGAGAAPQAQPAAAAPSAMPIPPTGPNAPVPPVPPIPPVPPVPPQGTTRAPDPHEIGVALGKAAEQVLGAFLRKKPEV